MRRIVVLRRELHNETPPSVLTVIASFHANVLAAIRVAEQIGSGASQSR
jgi:hypothetical protein